MKIYLFLLAGLITAAFCIPVDTTVLTGKVTEENGEALIAATVKIMKDTVLIKGIITDYNGDYRVELEPGVYDVEVSYVGYEEEQIMGVQVKANVLNKLDISLSSGAVLEEVVVSAYKAPLVEQDNTTSGQTLTMGAIRSAPRSKLFRSKKKDKRPAPMVSRPYKAVAYNVVPHPVKERPKSAYNSIIRDSVLPSDSSPETYATIHENSFLEANKAAVSTFSIDVDVASYSNARRFLQAGELPPADAVRIEEFVNYFDYQYPVPKGSEPFSVNTELSNCPWNSNNKLLLIGLQGRQIETGQLPPSNFVFLVDVSGSMNSPNKLGLVQQSLSMLTDQLRPHDKVAIVVYAGAAGLVLPSTAGSNKVAIKAAIQRLSAGGSTAGAAGIKLAYKIARKNMAHGGNNRVVLCTDGDFNVGMSSDQELVKLIERERETGVFLTVLGFGTGNYQDNKMQKLADKGNGNHAYIDQLSEAKKVLINEFGGTLFAIAKDVKIQIEFNPARVASYRLIGYENRLLAKEDFDDDKKDAGELGAGHRVTALYEIVPAKAAVATDSDDLLTLKLRYKKPKVGVSSQLITTTVADKMSVTPSNNFELAASVAEFGLLLRNSKYKGTASYTHCLSAAQNAAKTDPGGYRKELCGLIVKARKLANKTTARK